MVEQVAHPRKPWARVAGRFALALVLIIVSSAVSSIATGLVPSLITLASLIVLVWAVVGLVRAVAARRGRK